MTRLPVRLTALLLFTQALRGADPAAAPVCGVQQVTNTTGVTNITSTDLDHSGTRILFNASLDLTGGNPDRGLELFLFDTTTLAFTQVTSFNPTPLLLEYGSISSDGNRVLWRASNTLYGTVEPFLMTLGGGSPVQLTPNDLAGCGRPQMNGDGSRVAFSTIKDLTGGNPDRSQELFVHQLGAGFTQVTSNLEQRPDFPILDDAGERMLFKAGPPASGYDLYEVGPGGGIAVVPGVRIRDWVGDLVLSGDGSTGGFISEQDGAWNIYLRSDGQVRQITFAAPTSPAIYSALSISADGSRLVARRDAGGLTDVYLHDDATGIGGSVFPTGYYASLSGTGTRIAFVSWTDPVGLNPDQNWELFIATCSLPLTLMADHSELRWDEDQFAVGYDVVRGDLGILRATSGDLSQAITACLADDTAATSVPFDADPAAGEGYFYLARSILSTGPTTYDSRGRAQFAPRDPGIETSGARCP